MDVQQIKSYIETNCLDTHTMIIDESMEPWVAPQWRQDSLIHHRECVKQLRETRRINGRAGPRSRRAAHRRATHTAEIKRKGVSWPVNSMALAFVSASRLRIQLARLLPIAPSRPPTAVLRS
ncbi:hypothetical protein PF001_g30001 [Phytophthora fragariae]|uniref:Uncharacterized protein n=1 Tax=Phytophthora fragariae TaxID=53985 RepID=A0A6A4B697_9STRA|nr:hypothetical protein PF001_g30001 [Phytophthora fragariae]